MLEKVLKEAHEACEDNGLLSQLTIEELKEYNERNTKLCQWCPKDYHCQVCGATKEYPLDICYSCNKCGKWAPPNEEEYIEALYSDEKFESLISRGGLYY